MPTSTQAGEVIKMEHSKYWTSSISGVAGSSGGLQQSDYEIPWGEAQLRTHAGNIQTSPFFGLLVGSPRGYVFFTPKGEVDEFSPKRIAACLGAFAMPSAGVDEHLESTVEQYNYWNEIGTLSSREKPQPLKVKCAVTRFSLRPQLSIAD
jgi:hypothetical protein